MNNNSNVIKSVSFENDVVGENCNFISSKIEYINNKDDKFSDLNCSICLCPSIDPILCPNEHLFCRTCISKNYEYRNKCPQCNIDTDITTYITAVRPIQNILDNLEVFCLYKHNGCNKTMMRKDLFEHIKTCDHMNKKCEIDILNIEGNMIKCDNVYHINDVDKHHHCKYVNDGCPYIGPKYIVNQHEENCQFLIMTPIFNKFKNTILTLQTMIGKQEIEISNLQKSIACLQEDDSLKIEVEKLSLLVTPAITPVVTSADTPVDTAVVTTSDTPVVTPI